MFQRLRHTLQSKVGADGASPGKRGGLPTIHMGANPFDVPDPTLAPTGAQQGEACDLHRASVGSYELVNERDLMRSSHSSMSLVDYEPDAAPDMARAPTIDAAGVAAAVTSPAYVGSAGVQQPTQGADARTILARFLASSEEEGTSASVDPSVPPRAPTPDTVRADLILHDNIQLAVAAAAGAAGPAGTGGADSMTNNPLYQEAQQARQEEDRDARRTASPRRPPPAPRDSVAAALYRRLGFQHRRAHSQPLLCPDGPPPLRAPSPPPQLPGGAEGAESDTDEIRSMVSEKTTVTALKESYNDVVEKLLATDKALKTEQALRRQAEAELSSKCTQVQQLLAAQLSDLTSSQIIPHPHRDAVTAAVTVADAAEHPNGSASAAASAQQRDDAADEGDGCGAGSCFLDALAPAVAAAAARAAAAVRDIARHLRADSVLLLATVLVLCAAAVLTGVTVRHHTVAPVLPAVTTVTWQQQYRNPVSPRALSALTSSDLTNTKQHNTHNVASQGVASASVASQAGAANRQPRPLRRTRVVNDNSTDTAAAAPAVGSATLASSAPIPTTAYRVAVNVRRPGTARARAQRAPEPTTVSRFASRSMAPPAAAPPAADAAAPGGGDLESQLRTQHMMLATQERMLHNRLGIVRNLLQDLEQAASRAGIVLARPPQQPDTPTPSSPPQPPTTPTAAHTMPAVSQSPQAVYVPAAAVAGTQGVVTSLTASQAIGLTPAPAPATSTNHTHSHSTQVGASHTVTSGGCRTRPITSPPCRHTATQPFLPAPPTAARNRHQAANKTLSHSAAAAAAVPAPTMVKRVAVGFGELTGAGGLLPLASEGATAQAVRVQQQQAPAQPVNVGVRSSGVGAFKGLSNWAPAPLALPPQSAMPTWSHFLSLCASARATVNLLAGLPAPSTAATAVAAGAAQSGAAAAVIAFPAPTAVTPRSNVSASTVTALAKSVTAVMVKQLGSWYGRSAAVNSTNTEAVVPALPAAAAAASNATAAVTRRRAAAASSAAASWRRKWALIMSAWPSAVDGPGAACVRVPGSKLRQCNRSWLRAAAWRLARSYAKRQATSHHANATTPTQHPNTTAAAPTAASAATNVTVTRRWRWSRVLSRFHASHRVGYNVTQQAGASNSTGCVGNASKAKGRTWWPAVVRTSRSSHRNKTAKGCVRPVSQLKATNASMHLAYMHLRGCVMALVPEPLRGAFLDPKMRYNAPAGLGWWVLKAQLGNGAPCWYKNASSTGAKAARAVPAAAPVAAATPVPPALPLPALPALPAISLPATTPPPALSVRRQPVSTTANRFATHSHPRTLPLSPASNANMSTRAVPVFKQPVALLPRTVASTHTNSTGAVPSHTGRDSNASPTSPVLVALPQLLSKTCRTGRTGRLRAAMTTESRAEFDTSVDALLSVLDAAQKRFLQDRMVALHTCSGRSKSPGRFMPADARFLASSDDAADTVCHIVSRLFVRLPSLAPGAVPAIGAADGAAGGSGAVEAEVLQLWNGAVGLKVQLRELRRQLKAVEVVKGHVQKALQKALRYPMQPCATDTSALDAPTCGLSRRKDAKASKASQACATIKGAVWAGLAGPDSRSNQTATCAVACGRGARRAWRLVGARLTSAAKTLRRADAAAVAATDALQAAANHAYSAWRVSDRMHMAMITAKRRVGCAAAGAPGTPDRAECVLIRHLSGYRPHSMSSSMTEVLNHVHATKRVVVAWREAVVEAETWAKTHAQEYKAL